MRGGDRDRSLWSRVRWPLPRAIRARRETDGRCSFDNDAPPLDRIRDPRRLQRRDKVRLAANRNTTNHWQESNARLTRRARNTIVGTLSRRGSNKRVDKE